MKAQAIWHRMRQGDKMGYWFVAPTLILLLLVMVFPLGYAGFLSLHEVLPQTTRFVGLANYVRAFNDPAFWNSLAVSAKFTVISVSIHMVLGLGLALLLSQPFRGAKVFRFLLLIPWMVSQVVTGVIWRWILNAQYGVVNAVLQKLGFIEHYLPWLADVKLAPIAVIVAYTWQCLPFVMIMLYAGLQTIPKEQYEAAKIDGANGFQILRSVTIPNLKYVIVVTTLMDFIWAFRLFDLPKVMTDGGPLRATEMLSILVYRVTFEYYQFGYAAAIAMLMLLISLVLSVVYIRTVLSED